MTALADAINALRSAVSEAASGGPAAIRGSIEHPAFETPDVVMVPGEEALDHVSVSLVEPTRVEDLEAILGPGRWLPPNPSGGWRTVLFGDTLPDEGESGATVLAEVDEDGRARRLIVRADTF